MHSSQEGGLSLAEQLRRERMRCVSNGIISYQATTINTTTTTADTTTIDTIDQAAGSNNSQTTVYRFLIPNGDSIFLFDYSLNDM